MDFQECVCFWTRDHFLKGVVRLMGWMERRDVSSWFQTGFAE
jgi:hypothetical protein